MKETQKIIKYLAMAFALFLMVNIISVLFYGFSLLSNLFYESSSNINQPQMNLTSDASRILIDVNHANVMIQKGTHFSIKSDSDVLSVTQNEKQLTIHEKDHFWLLDQASTIVIYVPEEMVFDEVIIKTAMGKMNVEYLQTDVLSLKQGLGKVAINTLNVYEKADIETGGGMFSIDNGVLNNAQIEVGIGHLAMQVALKGEHSLDCGIGEIDLSLLGKAEAYQLLIDDGIGDVNVQDMNHVDKRYGSGENKLDISSGIAHIDVDFVD
ncbi:MAG: hypothetical protein EOM50_07865 [Erysipelotrichia bacterium]|nr:hypothetical protein [Erysipelotrichia bacterium]NCC53907.1 hypothetical protein [Erysipelotrichia bacterium]